MSAPDYFPVLTDHLGTPRKVLDDSGSVRWSWDAKEPFGNTLPQETHGTFGAFKFNLRFPGQWFDQETGLYHNGMRDYHPGLGRYLQSDPLGLEAGWNTYGYAKANPTIYFDLFGLEIIYVGEHRQNAEKAVQYMRRMSPTFRKIVELIEKSDRDYYINTNAKSNGYNPELALILWNPEFQLACTSWNKTRIFGPLSGLSHEFGHAYLDEIYRTNGVHRKNDEIGFADTFLEEHLFNLRLERAIHMEMGWPRGRVTWEYYLSSKEWREP